jgi:predicted phage baseplate assembly protein
MTQGSIAFTMNPAPNPSPYTVMVNVLGVSNGLIGQVVALPLSPVVQGSISVYIDDTNPLDNQPLLQYFQVDSLLDAGPTDNVFSVAVDDNQQVYLTFGDGFNGTIPTLGVNFYANYRVGGGAYGNTAAGTVVDVATSIPGVTVSGSSVMTGGQDPEGNEQIRANAPLAFQTQGRAVTLLDYQNLALGVTSVSASYALANTYNNVSVYILGLNGQLPNAALVAATQSYLDSRTLIGSTVTVLAPTQITINIGSVSAPVTVGVMPNANRASVTAGVVLALNNLIASYGLGGARVALSDVYGAISNVPGVQYAAVPLLARSDATQSGTSDILLRVSEIPIATLTSINVAATGGLG